MGVWEETETEGGGRPPGPTADNRPGCGRDSGATTGPTATDTRTYRKLNLTCRQTEMGHRNAAVDFVYLVAALMVLCGAAQGAEVYCGFHDNEASCDYVMALQYKCHIWARVNLCNSPVDVTFRIEMTNGSWKWAHTFVNRDEIQALAGLKEDINLHVSLETVKRGRLHIQGAFAVAGVSSDVFMDDSVLVDNATGCKAIGNANAYLPLVIFIILLVLIATLIAMFFGVRRHRTHRRQGELLANMEAPSAIYEDDPSTISSTVIKNNIYRDSIILENDTDFLDIDQHLGSGSGSGAEPRVRPPPPSGGRRKRLLLNTLPQPVLERLPEEPSEDDGSSSSSQTAINPSVTCT